MSEPSLEDLIRQEVEGKFPDIEISIVPDQEEPEKLRITFSHPSFAEMYPLQRYHKLMDCFSDSFFNEYLSDSIWIELAPDEKIEDLELPPDTEYLEEIEGNVLTVLNDHRFFHALYDMMGSDAKSKCKDNFAYSKRLMTTMGLSEENQHLFFHVLMEKGAYCDCEIIDFVLED